MQHTHERWPPRGAACVIADVASGEAIVSEIRAAGGEAEDLPTDVADEARVRDLAGQVRARFGGTDILVNNAALYSSLPPVKCLEIDADLWDRVMAVNVRGSFLAAKHFAPQMPSAGEARSSISRPARHTRDNRRVWRTTLRRKGL